MFLIDNNGREAVQCAQTDSNQAEDICPVRFFAPSGPANHRINVAGKKKGRTMNPLIQTKNATILPGLITLMLACGLSPQARAICREGCLTGNKTVLGEDALLNNTTGIDNTAIGFNALLNNTYGNDNTAIGFRALSSNTTASGNTATGASALTTTPTAASTRPTELLRSQTTSPLTTRPTVMMRSFTTQPATTTRPPELLRS